MDEENGESGEYDLDKTLIEFAKLPLEERVKFFEDIYAKVADKNKLRTMKVYFQDDENGTPKVVGIEDKNIDKKNMNNKTARLIRRYTFSQIKPIAGDKFRQFYQITKQEYKKCPRNKRFQVKQEMRERL